MNILNIVKSWMRNMHNTFSALDRTPSVSKWIKNMYFVVNLLVSLFYINADFHERITKVYGYVLLMVGVCLFLHSKMLTKMFSAKPLKYALVVLLLFPTGVWFMFHGRSLSFEIFGVPFEISFLGGLWHMLLAYFTYVLF